MEKTAESLRDYRAPVPYVLVFYLVLAAGTVCTAPLIYDKFEAVGWRTHWIYASMIAFFYAYTWFWSLGLFYGIRLDADGTLTLRSVRRRLALPAEKVTGIEGPFFPNWTGFIRLRLPRESGYLFCHGRTKELEEIFRGVRARNPLLKVKRM